MDNSLIICTKQFIQQAKQRSGQNSQHRERDILDEKVQKPFLQLLSKDKNNKVSGSVFAERIDKVKKTKFELELMKIVNCALDAHSNYDSNLVFSNLVN